MICSFARVSLHTSKDEREALTQSTYVYVGVEPEPPAHIASETQRYLNEEIFDHTSPYTVDTRDIKESVGLLRAAKKGKVYLETYSKSNS